MDVSTTTAPKSDQLNSDDLFGGPQTFTIEAVTPGSSEQPVNVSLAEIPGRPWRPSKSMRRVLIHAYGKESAGWIGKRVTLYRDPDVKFGGDVVGGIKVSHLSGIKGRLSIALTVTRGKKANHTVDPLPDAPKAAAEPTAEQVADCSDLDALRAMHRASKNNPERLAQIMARVAELTEPAPLIAEDN